MVAITTSRSLPPQLDASVRISDCQEEAALVLKGNRTDKYIVHGQNRSSIGTLSCSSDDSEHSRRSPPKAASASYIRSRFLNRLGISEAARVHMEEAPRRTSSRPRSGSFSEALKADYGKTDDTISSSHTSATSFDSSTSRKLSFDCAVTVHPIPARSRYSGRIRAAMWTPPAELHQNIARNSYEYAAEGWDWRQVADDEDMVVYAGERIHPIHFAQGGECSMRRQFLQVMSARQQN
jgi:hypothetical protein